MTIRQVIYCFALLFSAHKVCGQGHANNWYFGQNAGITFNSGTPTALLDGLLVTNEGCTSFSDENGGLIFYTDGINVWNRNHQVMPNGTGLNGHPSAAQSGVIVPKPGSSTSFYLFTVGAEGSASGFCYSEIDMNLDNGMGDVIAVSKNTQLITPATEKVAAVRHANGVDVWVISKKYNTNDFYAYLVTCNGVNAPIQSTVGLVEGWPGWGYLAVSPDGTKLASAARSNGFELFDFNNQNGDITNARLLYSPNEVYGVCFSPNSQLLYGLKIIGGNLYQWDLQAGTTANIIASRIDVAIVPGSGAPYRGGAIQQGPDGKLYITQYNQPFLSVINNPDVLGVGCGFQPNAVSLSNRNSVLGLPPFVINFLSAPAEITHSLPCLGMPVQFNLDIYTSDAITWDFGDPASGVNNVSNELNPTHIYNSTGTYAVMAIRQQSCVQDTFFVDVTIEPLNQIVHHDTICAGDTYVLPGGQIIANPGMYLDTLTNGSSCGEIHVYNLAWMVNDTIDVYVTVCDGEGYTLETGQTVYNSGTYNTYQNCQLKRVHITVLPAQSTTSEYTLCHNEVFTLPNGTSVSTGGTYTTPFQGQNGCDSLVVVVLNYLPQSLISNSITICEGDNYTGPNGALLNQPGLYTDTLQTLFGCDSIIHTNLFVSVSQVELNVEICSNRSYQRPSGGSVNQSGQYVDIIMSSAGCDSTVVTNLSVNPAYHNVQRLEYCRDEIMHRPNGQLIIDSGIYYDTLYTSLGCDSTFITEVVIHELPSDEFYWQPTVVKESDDFVMLIASDLGSSQNDWYINDLWVSSQQEFQYALKDLLDDEIEVCMLSTSNDGCISWSCKTIPVLPILRVYCPNAFTPNGDEQNEVFKPVVTGEDAQFYHFMIFNRWGEMIFETNNPDEGWLGNTNGGEYYVPNGVYAWVLEVKELATAEYYSFRGHVVLFR